MYTKLLSLTNYPHYPPVAAVDTIGFIPYGDYETAAERAAKMREDAPLWSVSPMHDWLLAAAPLCDGLAGHWRTLAAKLANPQGTAEWREYAISVYVEERRLLAAARKEQLSIVPLITSGGWWDNGNQQILEKWLFEVEMRILDLEGEPCSEVVKRVRRQLAWASD